MSSKRAADMGKINNFATVDIRDTTNPDDAVAAFLGKPIPSTAPGTSPTTTQNTIKASVGDQDAEETTKHEGPSTLDRTINEIVGTGQGLANRTYTGLSNTPIPGGIGIPLVILFVLFMILLPVNGHTRLMWLWLSLMGQAEIGGPLTPPTLTTASPGGFGGSGGGSFSYNTGSPSVNPNQTGTSSSKPPGATKITSATKKVTTVKTNTSKTHGTTAHKGGGPGPMDPGMNDPTAPISQMSYATLLVSRNGYE